MNPGRQLDALIAEKVMGWKFVVGKGQIELFNPANELIAWGSTKESIVKIGLYFPDYSTDIAAAWNVVEKFAAIDGHRSPAIISVFLGQEKPKGWCVSLGGVYSIFRETAPHGICLAALIAVGVEV